VARDYASKIQIISVKHPGLLRAVDTMFDEFATFQQVQEMIENKYQEKLSLQAVETYKNRHWKVQKEKIQAQLVNMRAIAKLVGEDGLTAGVTALLWQALQTMTVPQLMALKKVLNDDQKVALMKKQFALYAQEHRQKMKERSAAGKGNIEVVEDFEAARRMVEQAKEIFGIGTTAIARPVPKMLGPAEESRSPETLAVAGKESA
jgi:hypothetical protein